MTRQDRDKKVIEILKQSKTIVWKNIRIAKVIDAWTTEVIGKKRETSYKYDNNDLRKATNRLIDTQRRRAGLPEK